MWERLVLQVEGGYNDIVDEYIHALTCRDLLEDVVALIAPPRTDRIIEVVKPWDLRFYEATEGLVEPIHKRPSHPLQWWFYRVPAKQGPRFERHLQWWLEAEASTVDLDRAAVL